MSDYIKREDAIKALAKAFDVIPMPYALAEGILKDVPSVDAVEVVTFDTSDGNNGDV